MAKLANKPCRSYRADSVCADGFIQKPLCSGNAGCPTCGAISERAVPYCLRDEIPAHMATEAGRPLFYRETADDRA